MAFVAQTLQRGYRCDWNSSCFLEAQIGRLQRDAPIGARTDILRKRSGASAENLIPHLVLGYVFADRFNHPGVINPESRVLWFAQPTAHDSGQQHPSYEMSIERIDGNGSNSDQQLIVVRDRLFDLQQLEIPDAIVAMDDRLHR